MSSGGAAEADGGELYADVAVPVPLPAALTYSIPPPFLPLARVGCRARVRVGPRRLTGVIVALHSEPPDGVRLRPLEDVIDREPVVTAELLELARFTAEYYLTPIGEVVRAVLPTDLPPWGTRKVWLTDAGALARARDPEEEQVVATLREGGRMTLAQLQRRTGLPRLAELVDRLVEAGRLASGERDRRGIRYLAAVELPAGDREAQRAACGRSPQGRAVVDYLDRVGRPATVEEVTGAVGCSAPVVRRLVKLGVLRRFTQIERLGLDEHLLRPVEERERREIVLRPDQASAVEALCAAIEVGEAARFLLAGVTGAGKTEVYLRAAEAALAAGRTVILLVPEIALVPALARAAEERFGNRLAILHSGLTASQRQQEWERARRGEARIVLGPRSAIFAPLPDLGLVVVDEEQDGSYKQDSPPRYNGRDLALVRCRNAGAVAVLASATPSMESRLNVERGRYGSLLLTERAGQGQLPEGILVDLRQEEGIKKRPGEVHFSERLLSEIEAALAAGDQVILLRNRRGYSPILLCRACGEDLRCDQCGLPRTYHRRRRLMVCHYCGSWLAAPRRCGSCDEPALEPVGAGTERVEESFQQLFPQAAVDVLDRDTTRRTGGVAGVLERFGRGDTQVLVGTQMVSKGHHFPRVALTAVLSADTYLGFPDFRAVEKTYNLLTQLAGRAGRGDRPGRVVIQSFHPEHYAIQAALAHDDRAFADEEMRFRRVFHYPPYTRMIQLLLRDRNRERGEAAMRELARRLAGHPLAAGVRITGPAPAPLERIKNRWRFQLLVRSASGGKLRRLVETVLEDRAGLDLVVDVDPQQLL